MPTDPTLNELSDQQAMTHYAPPPNPAAPYLDAASKFYSGGLTEAFPAVKQAMPDWLNNIGGLFQGQAARDALSTANTGGVLPLLEIMGGTKGFEELAARGGSRQPLEDLELAKEMHARELFDRSQIRQATKWYKEKPSRIWNKEIYDNTSTLNEHRIPFDNNYSEINTTVENVLAHPDLYNIYPHLKDMPLIFSNDNTAYLRNMHAGFVSPRPDYPKGAIVIFNPHRTSSQEIKSSVLHELQHAVDFYEGRPTRASHGVDINDYFKFLEEGRARNTQWRAKYPADVLEKPGMDPWLTMEKMQQPFREEDFTLPP